MNLSLVPTETLQTWLTTAQGALAQLMSGGKVVSVSYSQGDGGRSVTYAAAEIGTLRAWLGSLEAEIGRRLGVFARPTRRAIGIRFGGGGRYWGGPCR